MGEKQGFENPERNESISADELTPLLERLHVPHTAAPVPDHYATVKAVCEATGASEDRVWDVLDEVRRNDLEARIGQRLTEAEAPLYSVERPDTISNSAESSLNRWARRRTTESILDRVQREAGNLRKFQAKEFKADPTSKFASTIILISIVLLFVAIAILAVIGLSQGFQPPGR